MHNLRSSNQKNAVQLQTVLIGAVVALCIPLLSLDASLIGNDFNGVLYNVNVSTGAAVSPRSTGIASLAGIAFDPFTGVLFGLTTRVSTPSNSLVRIDRSTGAFEIIGITGLEMIAEGDIAFDPLTGLLHGIGNGTFESGRELFTLDTLSGAASVIGLLPGFSDYSALAFNSRGELFAIDSYNDTLLTLDPKTGTIWSTQKLNVNLGNVAGLAFDPVSGLAYTADGTVGSTQSLYRLNTSTAHASLIGANGQGRGLAGLSFIHIIPEPEGSGLLAAGLVSLLSLCRWRSSVLCLW